MGWTVNAALIANNNVPHILLLFEQLPLLINMMLLKEEIKSNNTYDETVPIILLFWGSEVNSDISGIFRLNRMFNK